MIQYNNKTSSILSHNTNVVITILTAAITFPQTAAAYYNKCSQLSSHWTRSRRIQVAN